MLTLNQREKDYFVAMICGDTVEFPDGGGILSETQREDLLEKILNVETEEC